MESLSGPFGPILERQGFVLLDGGLATALEAEGHALDSSLWSARLLLDAPEAIHQAHVGYLNAGCDCITTASYQASFDGFEEAGFDAPTAEALILRSSTVALETRAAMRPQSLVAASVGPYGAYLADGSEYDGQYDITPPELDRFHRRRFEVLAASGVDMLACETIPSGPEAQVLLALLDEHPGTWSWLSFSCRDNRSLWDGTPIEEAVAACAAHAGVAAVGVNCTAPRHVPELIERAASVCDLPLIAYPNSGEMYDAKTKVWGGGIGDWMDGVRGALRAGARIVGGCCRVGPREIAELRTRLEGGDWIDADQTMNADRS